MMSALTVQCAAPPPPPPHLAVQAEADPPPPAPPPHPATHARRPKAKAPQDALAATVVRPRNGQTIVSYGNPVRVGLIWSGHAEPQADAGVKYFFDLRQDGTGPAHPLFSAYATRPHVTVVLPPGSADYRWRAFRVRARERSYEIGPWNRFSVVREETAPGTVERPRAVAATSDLSARASRFVP